jgi:hypothetical protein
MYTALISLPFAHFVVNASWSGGGSECDPFQLTRSAVRPTLPPGMSVDAAFALRGTVFSTKPIHQFRFALQFSSIVPAGSPESGECLDAQSFVLSDSRVMIGTEDGKSIAARHGWFRCTKKSYPIGYLPNGFELSVDYIPPGSTLDFHFIIAYNAIACDECSKWFAVDVPHTNLLQLDATVIRNGAK